MTVLIYIIYQKNKKEKNGNYYSTITGGVIMLVVNIIVAIFTLGFGLLLTWPICIIWAAIATKNHNEKLIANYSS